MPDPTPAANAAIWFTSDGYDPARRGINGRRVAGESFLRGFFTHGRVEEFVSVAHTQGDHAAFAEMARAAGVTRPLRAVRLDAPAAMAPVEVLHYPAPISAAECWRRSVHGAAAWALCGVTHTTATKNVMQALFDLRAAPQMPWDAVICTSDAVQASLRRLMELAEAHLAHRFPGAVLPARPLLPVIPLGIACDDFQPDPALGQELRARIGAAPGDVVAVTIARLTPDEKFDPLPLFLAMEQAAGEVRAFGGGKLHLVFCGQFREELWEAIYARAAVRLMPSCGYHLMDGGNPQDRKATLSGGDIFVFPIDNLQETFGLAPVEAMAAGLPVIVTDWDGMKDTVTPEVGIRVPSELPRAGLSGYITQRFLGGTDAYVQYLSQVSALTPVDVGAFARALVTLAMDPDLRARMGAMGQARARALYDWRAVIPQYQALWAEQRAMLAHARARGGPGLAPCAPAQVPVGPAVEEMFAAYPTRFAPPERRLAARPPEDRPPPAEMFALRNYALRRRLIDDPARIEAVRAAYAAAGPGGATEAEIGAALRLPPSVVGRAALWLLKYDYLVEVS
ncbi:glycosyltransferase family 4 protein [Rhodobacter calidifons]|uniref:Glycosyltransferase family 4 protein n=1 Tax=Rhodobacter calidifons TaxID=2715277 RepID=A0ABX0G7Q2_9RHOB|nr:glycosyltransferase family 4 protein [Rhodobacter calidifons]NHB76889.1 glycosyltransferase family 4 protein [Rhodobacter calidifons]